MDIMELMERAEIAINAVLAKKYKGRRFIDDVAWGEDRFRLPIYEIGSNPMDCHGVAAFSFRLCEGEDPAKMLDEAVAYFLRYQL